MADGRGFEVTFPGETVGVRLDELRSIFLRKSFVSRQEKLCRALLADAEWVGDSPVEAEDVDSFTGGDDSYDWVVPHLLERRERVVSLLDELSNQYLPRSVWLTEASRTKIETFVPRSGTGWNGSERYVVPRNCVSV